MCISPFVFLPIFVQTQFTYFLLKLNRLIVELTQTSIRLCCEPHEKFENVSVRRATSAFLFESTPTHRHHAHDTNTTHSTYTTYLNILKTITAITNYHSATHYHSPTSFYVGRLCWNQSTLFFSFFHNGNMSVIKYADTH